MANGISNLGGGVAPFWGDGSDGILSAGATYLAGTDFEKYSGFCIKQFSEIDWDPEEPETLTVDEPCRGLILFVDGDVNIGANATISMAKKGSVLPCNPQQLLDDYGASKQMQYIVDKLLTLHGGAGGNGGDGGGYNGGVPGTGGTGGIGRRCQGGFGAGGGGGASGTGYYGGNGGDIQYPEVIGQSGGPADGSSPNYGYDGWNGGAGGAGARSWETTQFPRAGGQMYGAGPGGGSWGSSATNGSAGEHTGGFILIVAKGNITISGTLDVTGGNGGNASGPALGGGGGGAGGGVIAVFARGAITSTFATKTLTGGAGGTGYTNGTNGGVGTYYEEQI